MQATKLNHDLLDTEILVFFLATSTTLSIVKDSPSITTDIIDKILVLK